MSYHFYKFMHYWGLLATFVSLGGLIANKISSQNPTAKLKRVLMMTHGLGLLATLLGGFGMLAKINAGHPMPNWVLGKLVIWLLLGGCVVLIKRGSAQVATLTWWVLPIFGVVASYLAIVKI